VLAPPSPDTRPPAPPRDLARIVLSVLFLGGLLILSLWILKPFLPALLWATTIVIATWPLMLRVQAALWNRRWLAVLVMTGAFLLIFIVPFTLAVAAIVANVDVAAERARSLVTLPLPQLPAWVDKVPFFGQRMSKAWSDLTAASGPEIVEAVRPYVGTLARWFAAQVGNLGALFLQFLLTVLATAILYYSGEAAAERVRRFALRLAGAQGEGAVRLAAQAIRGVALGVVLTAIVQSVAAGIGLLVAGIPFVAVLTAVMFMLSLAQLGPLLVMLPAVGWLYWSGSSGWGTFLVVWTLVVTPIDNVLRPVLIRRGVNLSLLLVFTGVVGGLIAFGLVGIFIGPVVLAVSSTLLSAWVEAGLAQAAAGTATPSPVATTAP
jgi:predicted PurR-regulated permease PerM